MNDLWPISTPENKKALETLKELPKNRYIQLCRFDENTQVEMINIIEQCNFILFDEFGNFKILDVENTK